MTYFEEDVESNPFLVAISQEPYLGNLGEVLLALQFVIILKTDVDELLASKLGGDFVVGKLFQFRPIVSLCQGSHLAIAIYFRSYVFLAHVRRFSYMRKFSYMDLRFCNYFVLISTVDVV